MGVLLSNSDEPVHRQVAHQVRLLIARSYAPGAVLPTYRELSDQLGVGLRSVSAAMKLLAEQGVVNPVRRRGTVVLRQVEPGEARLTQVGLILGRPMHWIFKGGFLGQIMHGISTAISDARANLRVFPHTHDHGIVRRGEVISSGVEGVVFLTVADNEYIASFAQGDIPAVVADHKPGEVPIDSVVCDNATTARDVVRHLAELGHRNVAYVESFYVTPARESGRMTHVQESDPAERKRGFMDACEEFGIEVHLPCIRFPGWAAGMSGEFRAGILDMIRNKGRSPTAIVTDDESGANCLMLVLDEEGVGVPRDISVATIAQSVQVLPTLRHVTGCVMNFMDMGAKAIELLELRLRTPKLSEPNVVRIPGALRLGDTVRRMN